MAQLPGVFLRFESGGSEPPSIRFCPYFYGFSGVNTSEWKYHKIYGISSVIRGKYMACIRMKKEAINSKKLCTMHDQAGKSEFSWNDDAKYGNDSNEI